ncbi:MAG: hypothetical protein AAGC64_08520 [Bacteroidota bacterium]
MIDRKDVFEFEMIQYCDKENLRMIFIYYHLLPHFGGQFRSSVFTFYPKFGVNYPGKSF